jgi:phosphoglycolate phosphatase
MPVMLLTPDPEHLSHGDTDRVAIFDLDGTLVDSIDGMTAAINRMLEPRGFAALRREEAAPLLGHGLETFARRAFEQRGWSPTRHDIQRFIWDYLADPLQGTRLYPGIKAVLMLLAQKGWRLAVCTNKAEAAAQTILRYLDVLGYFDVVCGGDTVPWQKPDPRHIGETLRRGNLLGLPAVMIGDNAVDLSAAHGYGIPGAFVTWGYGQISGRASAYHTATKTSDLPELLNQVLRSAQRREITP